MFPLSLKLFKLEGLHFIKISLVVSGPDCLHLFPKSLNDLWRHRYAKMRIRFKAIKVVIMKYHVHI